MKEELRILINKLNEATKAYDEGHPIMTDVEWDALYFRLQDLENELQIFYPDSPTQSINYQIVNQLEKIEHKHSMLSLSKTKDLEEVKKFANGRDCIFMPKMDGLTCSLTYENGKLVRAETRGNGYVGENILHNAAVINSIPQRIPYKDVITIDGEIICRYKDFERFSSEYKNPRNFAAGSIRLLDSNICAERELTFVAWDIINTNITTLSEKLKYLGDILGFITVKYFVTNCGISEVEIENIINELKSSSMTYSYPIDGIVVKVNDCIEYSTLGTTAHHPCGALAYKFYDEEYESNLIDIEFSMGRSGVLTPVAIFEPIEMDDGTTVTRASLHNLSIMKQLLAKPYCRQKVWVAKMNMIIPQIVKAERRKPEHYTLIEIPKVCPTCGAPTEIKCDINTEILVCTNPDCESKIINRIDHFCGKKGLDMKGISKATLEKLIDLGWLNSIADIFTLHEHREEWYTVKTFGEKSVNKILNSIESSRQTTLDKFIAALGIPLIGPTVAKEIARREESWEEFRYHINEGFDFSTWEGFGTEMANSICNYRYDEADEIAEKYLTISNPFTNWSENAEGSLSDQKIVITGKLTHFANRKELQEVIEKNGGRVTSSVSRSTDILISNDSDSTSSKMTAAKEFDMIIMTEEEFIEAYLNI